jgi:hypothetical protein
MRDRQGEHGSLLTRRQVLQGAAGLGLAAVAGSLLPACGRSGRQQSTGTGAAGPLETTSIRLHNTYPASCIAAEYMAEPFLREEGFTDVQYPLIAPGAWVDSFAAGSRCGRQGS